MQVTERRSMNGFYLVGRITGIPEKAETASGITLCRLRICVSRTNKDQENEDEIFEIVLFRSLAEERYEEGKMVAVAGRIQANNFEKEGNTYYHANLIGNSVTVIQ